MVYPLSQTLSPVGRGLMRHPPRRGEGFENALFLYQAALWTLSTTSISRLLSAAAMPS